MNIITWYEPSKNGAFQKVTEFGIYSDLITVKPIFSFDFTNMSYNETNGDFSIDGVDMTNDQIAEAKSIINQITPPDSWIKQVKSQKAVGYLASTDWYYTRQMETQEPVPEDVVIKRIAAREYIRSIYNDTPLSTPVQGF